jgi:anti-sigma factor RsiW
MSERDDDTLLAAYLDGVGELTTDERRRVEARLADDPGLRAEADNTRALLGQLRELPPEGAEPDWAAMERAIRAEVGDAVPRPWWRGWWIISVGALAMAGAMIALVVRMREPAEVIAVPDAAVARLEEPVTAPEPDVPVGDTMPLWLDGHEVNVDLEAAEQLGDDELSDEPGTDLMTGGDLAWVDELGDDDIATAEAFLARKKS